MSDDKRVHIMKALSSLAKFLGIYGEFRELVKDYGLKWRGRSSDDLIIERLARVQNPNEIFEWIRNIKREFPELRCFMDLHAATGLRFVETVSAYNRIIDCARSGRLKEYYNQEKQVLEHFRFREIFLRCSKKAFISFIPENIIEEIVNHRELNIHTIQTKVKRKAGLRFSDVRELHGTLLTRYLRQPEIDFLHGRVSNSVFMQNYFNPAWITDLKERALSGSKEILQMIALG